MHTHTESTVCSRGELAGRWEGPRRVGVPGSSRQRAGQPHIPAGQVGAQDTWSREEEQAKGERNGEGHWSRQRTCTSSNLIVILWQWQYPPKFMTLSFYRVPDFLGSPHLFTTTHGVVLKGTAFPSCSRCPATWLLPPPRCLKQSFSSSQGCTASMTSNRP